MGLCNEKSTDLNLDTIPIVSIEQAIQPLISLFTNIEQYLRIVKDKCLHPSDGLTSDESASIMLYSMLWQSFDQYLYIIFHSTLQTQVQPWLCYLKILFTALLHLPSNHLIVYRGSKTDLKEEYRLNEIILWRDLSLCTNSMEDLQSEKNLRTILTIDCQTGKNIQQHCYYQPNHFVLFLPGTKFRVVECVYQNPENLILVKLQEIESSFILHSDRQISRNICQRFCLLFQPSGNDFPSTHRNPSLEHRIMNHEHSWTLDLDKQNLIDRDMKIVVRYAIKRNHCKRIRLRDNHITAEGSSILSKGLSNNTTLESLDLRNNSLGDIGVQFLSLAIVYSNIKTLNLESNEITAEGAGYLAQMLKDSRTLAELYLSKNHLGDRGVELIAKALSDETRNSQEQSNKEINQSSLQHLYLGQNEITDEGVKHLSNMLKTNRTLTWLWLTENEISNDGIEYLANILVDYNLTLEWLFLNSNKLINDSSIDDLIHMLQRNQTLKTLYLNNCNLSEITKRKLLQTIKNKKDFDLEV